jgi:hypothetical protein
MHLAINLLKSQRIFVRRTKSVQRRLLFVIGGPGTLPVNLLIRCVRVQGMIRAREAEW